MKALALLLALLLQNSQATPPFSVRTALRQLRDQYNDHKTTLGATAELTTAKHQLRDWIEGRLADQGEKIDVTALAATIHAGLTGADLFCNDFQDECFSNNLGYVDEARVSRAGDFLVIVTALGIYCGYDESAYMYSWDGQRWRRIWDHEQMTYTEQGYLPQTIHDIQISSPDASGRRALLLLGSRTVCGGSYKDLYARAWRVDRDYRAQEVLTWAEYANDGYPPIQGRVRSDDVLFEFISGGRMSGATHRAVRHFRIDQSGATPLDPIATRPRDFVLEWLNAPWEQSRTRSGLPSLEALHAQLRKTDGVGDFADATLKCTTGADLWQVGTNLFEGPKRYYRVRWQSPYTFTMVGISETPYSDCTMADKSVEVYPNLLDTGTP